MKQLRNANDLRTLKDRLSRLPMAAARIAVRAAELFSASALADMQARKSIRGEPYPTGITLHKTGRLARLASAYQAIGNKVRASVSSVPYAKFNLRFGFLPRTLPSAWSDSVSALAREELSSLVEDGR